jgi:hypothetical protein
MKRLNKKAVLENTDLKPLLEVARKALSEYIRKDAMQQLEKDPTWNHDISKFDLSSSNCFENNDIQLREFCEYMVDQEMEFVLDDYPYDGKR